MLQRNNSDEYEFKKRYHDYDHSLTAVSCCLVPVPDPLFITLYPASHQQRACFLDAHGRRMTLNQSVNWRDGVRMLMRGVSRDVRDVGQMQEQSFRSPQRNQSDGSGSGTASMRSAFSSSSSSSHVT